MWENVQIFLAVLLSEALLFHQRSLVCGQHIICFYLMYSVGGAYCLSGHWPVGSVMKLSMQATTSALRSYVLEVNLT
jgi:hypothetical protein